MLFFGVFFEVGKERLTQLLRRRELVPLTKGVKFRIAVAPAVIFFFTDLACFQLGGITAPHAAEHPDLCRQTDDDEQGGLTFEIDRRRFAVRLTAPYSDERRQAASELAKKNGSKWRV